MIQLDAWTAHKPDAPFVRRTSTPAPLNSKMETLSTGREIDKLIDLLVENALVVVPGPKIARQCGVTRSGVWMWIKKLREHGVEIDSRRGEGYQLRKLPDLLTPGLVRRALGECEIGKRITHYFTVSSTNSVALGLAAGNAPHGAVVTAEEQTAGRGRMGRKWYSEKSSGIYASVILRPPLAPAAAAILTLMAGVALSRAVEEETHLAADIRWPNDLMLGGKKAGGILTEMTSDLDRIQSVVVGIGLNVNHTAMPTELRASASSLRLEGGKIHSRVQILARLLRQLDRNYRMLLGQGSASVINAWEQKSSYARGKRVLVRTASGERAGMTDGLEPNGALRMRFDDGRTESLLSGEVIEIK
ncbi:MAG: biotin--[acetyl-CoA-carboxylase] ligase [Acidobacteriota bacterium]|nr:biotin--[acetyl-CoA-carboxylase] ligase [Acidobacteriota bacterium]